MAYTGAGASCGVGKTAAPIPAWAWATALVRAIPVQPHTQALHGALGNHAGPLVFEATVRELKEGYTVFKRRAARENPGPVHAKHPRLVMSAPKGAGETETVQPGKQTRKNSVATAQAWVQALLQLHTSRTRGAPAETCATLDVCTTALRLDGGTQVRVEDHAAVVLPSPAAESPVHTMLQTPNLRYRWGDSLTPVMGGMSSMRKCALEMPYGALTTSPTGWTWRHMGLDWWLHGACPPAGALGPRAAQWICTTTPIMCAINAVSKWTREFGQSTCKGWAGLMTMLFPCTQTGWSSDDLGILFNGTTTLCASAAPDEVDAKRGPVHPTMRMLVAGVLAALGIAPGRGNVPREEAPDSTPLRLHVLGGTLLPRNTGTQSQWAEWIGPLGVHLPRSMQGVYTTLATIAWTQARSASGLDTTHWLRKHVVPTVLHSIHQIFGAQDDWSEVGEVLRGSAPPLVHATSTASPSSGTLHIDTRIRFGVSPKASACGPLAVWHKRRNVHALRTLPGARLAFCVARGPELPWTVQVHENDGLQRTHTLRLTSAIVRTATSVNVWTSRGSACFEEFVCTSMHSDGSLYTACDDSMPYTARAQELASKAVLCIYAPAGRVYNAATAEECGAAWKHMQLAVKEERCEVKRRKELAQSQRSHVDRMVAQSALLVQSVLTMATPASVKRERDVVVDWSTPATASKRPALSLTEDDAYVRLSRAASDTTEEQLWDYHDDEEWGGLTPEACLPPNLDRLGRV